MGTPDIVFESFLSLPSTTTNIFNVKPSPSANIRKLQPIIRDLRIHLSPLFCDGVDHVMEGLAYKRSAPLRHFYFWRRVKDCMRNAKRVGDGKLTALVGNIEQKLLQSSSYSPRTSVLMYLLAALVARLARLAQIRQSACAATDEMIGHMEKSHWLAFARFLIGLIADLSARAKEDGQRIIKIIDRLSEWIVEYGDDEDAKSALQKCESISEWWRSEAAIGKKGSKPDETILRRLMVVSDNDVVATRIIQALKTIEAEEKQKNNAFVDLGKSIRWNGVKGREEEERDEQPTESVKEEVESEEEEEVEEKEIKIEEEDEVEERWTIDRGNGEEKAEDDVIKKEEEDDDGWADFTGVQIKPETWKKKKKKLRVEKRSKEAVEESTVVLEEITVVEEAEKTKRKKKKKRMAEIEVESVVEEASEEPVKKKKKKLKMNAIADSISISERAAPDSMVAVKKKKKKKSNKFII